MPEEINTNKEFERGLDNLDLQADAVVKQVVDLVTPEILERIKMIAYHISDVGMSLDEACTLSEIDYDKFLEVMEKYPVVKRLINLKKLRYKMTLLKTISSKAKTDDKLAMILLEAKFPEEFGKGKKTNTSDSDPLKDAIDYIRKNGDSKPLVGDDAGRSAKRGESKGVLQSIKDLLK